MGWSMPGVLIDSSVYIDWLRRRHDFVRELQPWLVSGTLFQCGVIRVEVLRGIREPRQRARMDQIFEIASEVQLSPVFWDRVLGLALRLDRAGLMVPIPDLVVAQAAIDTEAVLVSLDGHFERIPGLRTSRILPF